MSEMVERVARSLCVMCGNDPDATTKTLPFWPEGSARPFWTLFEQHARTALDAMREPTEAMVEAASDGAFLATDATVAWWRMIDEALKD